MRPRKNPENNIVTADKTALDVVAKVGDFENEKTAVNSNITGDCVYIACHLEGGVKFDGVPDGNGGTKTVTFPGINDDLRGKRTGILLSAGKSIAVKIPRTEWEWIKSHYGDSGLFKWNNGVPPCLLECQTLDEFNNREEVKHQVSGFEPSDGNINGEVQGIS